MDAASTDRKKTLERAFELAFRLLEGEPLDVQTLQRELQVSRATAYRYWRLARLHRSNFGKHRALPGAPTATHDAL